MVRVGVICGPCALFADWQNGLSVSMAYGSGWWGLVGNGLRSIVIAPSPSKALTPLGEISGVHFVSWLNDYPAVLPTWFRPDHRRRSLTWPARPASGLALEPV